MSYKKKIYWIEESSYSSENQLKDFDQILNKANQRKVRLQMIRATMIVLSIVSLIAFWKMVDLNDRPNHVDDSVNELNSKRVMSGVKDSVQNSTEAISRNSLQDSIQRFEMLKETKKSINKEIQDKKEELSPSGDLPRNVESSEDESHIILLEKADQENMLKANSIITDSIALEDPKRSNVPASSVEEKNVEAVYTNAFPLIGFDSLYHYLYRGIDSKLTQDQIDTEELSIYFYIDVEGKPSEVLVKGVESDTVVQLIKSVVEQMPDWKPAMINDQPVRRQFMLPLKFETDDK